MLSSHVFASQDLVTLPRARRPRLRSIDTGSAAALRALCCRCDELPTGGASELSWRFCWLKRSASRRSVVLRGMHAQAFLSLAEDGLREPLGCREWWDYTDESSLFAWTLAHTSLLDGLGRLLGDSLLPEAWQEPAAAPGEMAAVLAFEASSTDHKLSCGELLLPPRMLAQLAANASCHMPRCVDAGWAARLPAELRMVLRACEFPYRELTAARCGDVLVLGPRSHCLARLALIYAPGRHWSARYGDGRLEIVGAVLKESTRNHMSESISEESGEAALGSALDSVPVTLDFEVGTLSVSMADLAALQPGYVFELAARLEDAPVVIRANGIAVGRGELVAVGDTLGVQLLSLHQNGSR